MPDAIAQFPGRGAHESNPIMQKRTTTWERPWSRLFPGRSSEAVAEFETALRINPDFAEAHHNLGCALANMAGRMPEAIAQFQAAVQLKPDFARAHCDLGLGPFGAFPAGSRKRWRS